MSAIDRPTLDRCLALPSDTAREAYLAGAVDVLLAEAAVLENRLDTALRFAISPADLNDGVDPGAGLRRCCWDGSHPGLPCPNGPTEDAFDGPLGKAWAEHIATAGKALRLVPADTHPRPGSLQPDRAQWSGTGRVRPQDLTVRNGETIEFTTEPITYSGDA